jgi:GT2 family glycosyltransferase
MPEPLSIVIPSHNRADLLGRCLGSVVAHAPPLTRVLVVDDASPGGIVERTARGFPGVEVHRLDARGGFCVAANAGISRTHGEVVQVLNDDTEVSAGWVEAALARFADSRVAAVTPLVLLGPPGQHFPERVDSTGDVYMAGGWARKRGHGQPLARRHLVAGPVFGASGSGSFYRRSALVAVGGFPEEFVAYFDDVDLSFRLRRAGWTIFYEPASRIHHCVSSSYGPPRAELLALMSRNEELVWWRNLPPAGLLCLLPLHLAVLLAKGLRRWSEGQLTPFLRGRLEALVVLLDRLARQRDWPGRRGEKVKVGGAVPTRRERRAYTPEAR